MIEAWKWLPPFSILSGITPGSIQDLAARQLPVRHPEFATPIRFRPKAELDRDLRHSLDEYQVFLECRDPGQDWAAMQIVHPLLGTRDLLRLPGFVANHERRHIDKMLKLLNTLKS